MIYVHEKFIKGAAMARNEEEEEDDLDDFGC
jgi:hypothetical protein